MFVSSSISSRLFDLGGSGTGSDTTTGGSGSSGGPSSSNSTESVLCSSLSAAQVSQSSNSASHVSHLFRSASFIRSISCSFSFSFSSSSCLFLRRSSFFCSFLSRTSSRVLGVILLWRPHRCPPPSLRRRASKFARPLPRSEEARSRAATAATARRKPSRSEPGVEAMVARVFSARALLPGLLEFAGSVEMECPPLCWTWRQEQDATPGTESRNPRGADE